MIAHGELTGNTRHRVERVGVLGVKILLVLQVEFVNHDHDFSPSDTLWRDARVEDLATIYPLARASHALKKV